MATAADTITRTNWMNITDLPIRKYEDASRGFEGYSCYFEEKEYMVLAVMAAHFGFGELDHLMWRPPKAVVVPRESLSVFFTLCQTLEITPKSSAGVALINNYVDSEESVCASPERITLAGRFGRERRRRRMQRRVSYVSELAVEAIMQSENPASLTEEHIAQHVKARFVSGFFGALMLSAFIEFLPVIIRIVMRALKIHLGGSLPFNKMLGEIDHVTTRLVSQLGDPEVDYFNEVERMKSDDDLREYTDMVDDLAVPLLGLWEKSAQLEHAAEV